MSDGFWKCCLEILNTKGSNTKLADAKSFWSSENKSNHFERESPCASTSYSPNPTNCTFNCSVIEDGATMDQQESKHISEMTALELAFKPNAANDNKYLVLSQMISSLDVSVGIVL